MSGREKKKLNVNMSKLVRNIVIEEKILVLAPEICI